MREGAGSSLPIAGCGARNVLAMSLCLRAADGERPRSREPLDSLRIVDVVVIRGNSITDQGRVLFARRLNRQVEKGREQRGGDHGSTPINTDENAGQAVENGRARKTANFPSDIECRTEKHWGF